MAVVAAAVGSGIATFRMPDDVYVTLEERIPYFSKRMDASPLSDTLLTAGRTRLLWNSKDGLQLRQRMMAM